MKMCTVDEGSAPIWAIGTTLRNDEAYTSTAIIRELGILPKMSPIEDFRIVTTTEGGEELHRAPLDDLQPGDEQTYVTLLQKSRLLASDLFPYDAAGHLSFYSSYFLTILYSRSPSYPESSGC